MSVTQHALPDARHCCTADDAVRLLRTLLEQGGDAWVVERDGERELRVDAPKSLLTEGVVASLRAHKPAMLDWLAAQGYRYPVYPTTVGQRALWTLHQLDPADTAYNLIYVAELTAAVERRHLASALARLIERHEILRTTYEEREGRVVQRVHAPSGADGHCLMELDWRGHSAGTVDRKLRALADKPFDLARGPVLRAYWIATDDRPLLALCFHHIAADFWSLEVMVSELALHHRAIREDRVVALPELTCQYRDHARAEQAFLASEQAEAQWRYWNAAVPEPDQALELPLDFPRPETQTTVGDEHHRQLPQALSDALRDLAGRLGSTPYATMLAAFQLLLAYYADQSRFPMGTPAAGRNRAALEPMVGYFANPMVFPVALEPAMTFEDWVASVRGQLIQQLEHADYPFSLLVERLYRERGCRRDVRRPPLFQVNFAWDKVRAPAQHPCARDLVPALEGLVARDRMFFQRGCNFDLSVTVIDRDEGGMDLGIKYNTDLFRPETARAFLDDYVALLEAIRARPQARVIDLVPAAAAPARPPALPDAAASARRFEQVIAHWARWRPEASAIDEAGETLTYAGLAETGARVARELLARGAQPGERVVLALERSSAWLIAVIACWFAGLCPVPLDPRWPRERREDIRSRAGQPATTPAARAWPRSIPGRICTKPRARRARTRLYRHCPTRISLHTCFTPPVQPDRRRVWKCRTARSTGTPRASRHSSTCRRPRN